MIPMGVELMPAMRRSLLRAAGQASPSCRAWPMRRSLLVALTGMAVVTRTGSGGLRLARRVPPMADPPRWDWKDEHRGILPRDIARKFRLQLGIKLSVATATATSIMLAAQPVARAQSVPRTTIPDALACETCSIRVLLRQTIADQTGPGIIDEPRGIARDSSGRLFLSFPRFPGEIKVYDPEGKYLRHLTRPGSGPGEALGAPRVHITRGDTIRVFDQRNTRYSVFSPDFRFVRDSPFRLPYFAAVPLDSTLMIVAAPRFAAGGVQLLHSIDLDGNTVASTTASGIQATAAEPYLLWRHLAREDDRNVWAVTQYGYALELWNVTTGLQREIRRNPEWYTPGGPDAVRNWQPGVTPPPAAISSIHRDAQGRLWVVAGVAKKDWRRAYERDTAPGFLMWDAVLELIDPANNVVIARERMPHYPVTLLGNELVTYGEDASGNPTIRFWSIRLDDVKSKGGTR